MSIMYIYTCLLNSGYLKLVLILNLKRLVLGSIPCFEDIITNIK